MDDVGKTDFECCPRNPFSDSRGLQCRLWMLSAVRTIEVMNRSGENERRVRVYRFSGDILSTGPVGYRIASLETSGTYRIICGYTSSFSETHCLTL